MPSYTNAAIVLLVAAGITMLGSAALKLGAPGTGPAQPQDNAQNYAQYTSSELADKCATPPGYTDEQWKTHMSHHPDRYKGCS